MTSQRHFQAVCHELLTALGYVLLPKEGIIYVKASCIVEAAKMALSYPGRSLSKSLHGFASDTAMDRISRATSSGNQLETYFLQNALDLFLSSTNRATMAHLPSAGASY